MLRLEALARVWLVLGRTDMRKSINGLSDIVANELRLDAMSWQYFVFCGRLRDILKLMCAEPKGIAFGRIAWRLTGSAGRGPSWRKTVTDGREGR
jgi:transposase